MRVRIYLKPMALFQKMIGWAMVIMASVSTERVGTVVAACVIGLLINEMSDVWYKLAECVTSR